MVSILTIVKLWISSKIRILEYLTVILIIFLTFYSGYHVKSIVDESKETEDLQKEAMERAKIQDGVNAVSSVYELKIHNMELQYDDLQKQLIIELKKPAYSCIIPPSGVRLLNNTIHPPGGSK